MSCNRAVAIALISLCCFAAPGVLAQGRSTIHDFVILKDGTTANGTVKVDIFVLKTKYGTLNIPKKDILEIEYKNPKMSKEDEVQLSAGTRLKGELEPAVVKVTVETLGDLDIPKTDIRAIMIQRPIESVSEATKKALGRGGKSK